jgi:hypothetical protein
MSVGSRPWGGVSISVNAKVMYMYPGTGTTTGSPFTPSLPMAYLYKLDLAQVATHMYTYMHIHTC